MIPKYLYTVYIQTNEPCRAFGCGPIILLPSRQIKQVVRPTACNYERYVHDQIEVFKITHGIERLDSGMFF